MTGAVIANFPIIALIVLGIVGVPLWMTFKRPDEHPDYAEARAYFRAKAAAEPHVSEFVPSSPVAAVDGLTVARRHLAPHRAVLAAGTPPSWLCARTPGPGSPRPARPGDPQCRGERPGTVAAPPTRRREPGQVPAASYHQGVLRGVITYWGGVPTGPLLDTVRAWIAADDIDFDSYLAVMRPWVTGAYESAAEVNPIHALELGQCTDAEFEQLLAAQIVRRDGTPVPAVGLLDRMFAASTLSQPMLELLRQLRAAGVRTALLSNSWGVTGYPIDLFPELFDSVVISAEVGMRKPEERIFRHAASCSGWTPRSACSWTIWRPTCWPPRRSA